MNRPQLSVFLCLSLGLFAAACPRQEPSLDAFWRTDLGQAAQVAYETGKPMLVVFR